MACCVGLYTDESPGLKVDPFVVMVLSIGFIISVVALHSTFSNFPPTDQRDLTEKSNRSYSHCQVHQALRIVNIGTEKSKCVDGERREGGEWGRGSTAFGTTWKIHLRGPSPSRDCVLGINGSGISANATLFRTDAGLSCVSTTSTKRNFSICTGTTEEQSLGAGGRSSELHHP